MVINGSESSVNGTFNLNTIISFSSCGRSVGNMFPVLSSTLTGTSTNGTDFFNDSNIIGIDIFYRSKKVFTSEKWLLCGLHVQQFQLFFM